MRLGNPQYLLWLLSLIPIALLLFFFLYRRLKRSKYFGDERVYSLLTRSLSKRKVVIKYILFFLALAFLGVAVINPQIGTRLKDVKQKGIELVIAIDVSNSMLARDVDPSRLQRAKYEISDMIDDLGGNRAGLVVFAGSAFQQCPMTSDHSALKMFIDILSPNLISTQGTNFAAAIETSLSTIEQGEKGKEKSSKSTQAIIIVSDGENNEEGADAAIAKAKEKGIKIFTVGIGSDKGTPIPIGEGEQIADYKRDQSGNIVTTTFNENSLVEIARKTNGEFYRISSGGSNFDKIVETLKSLDQQEIESKQLVDYDDKYQIFLLIAIALLLFEASMGDKKSLTKKKA